MRVIVISCVLVLHVCFTRKVGNMALHTSSPKLNFLFREGWPISRDLIGPLVVIMGTGGDSLTPGPFGGPQFIGQPVAAFGQGT